MSIKLRMPMIYRISISGVHLVKYWIINSTQDFLAPEARESNEVAVFIVWQYDYLASVSHFYHQT